MDEYIMMVGLAGISENTHSYTVTIATFIPDVNIFDLRSWERLQ